MKNYSFDFYNAANLKAYNLNDTMRYQLAILDRMDPITKKHGFSYYILKENDILIAIQNANYNNLPQLKVVKPSYDEKLGIIEGKSVFAQFAEDPDIFRYLDHPEEYEAEIENLLK